MTRKIIGVNSQLLTEPITIGALSFPYYSPARAGFPPTIRGNDKKKKIRNDSVFYGLFHFGSLSFPNGSVGNPGGMLVFTYFYRSYCFYWGHPV